MEAEEMISEIRSQQGRPFDIKQLTMSCVGNVIINMALGRRFDHSDSEFQRLIIDISEVASKYSFEVEFFPLLSILPHYKKRISDIHFFLERIFAFIDAKVTECREVLFSSIIIYQSSMAI